MINTQMEELGKAPSKIREIFEYGKRRKAEIGEDRVFDFSIGNPNVPAPAEVNAAYKSLIDSHDDIWLHGYTSAAGDLDTRWAIVKDLNRRFGTSFRAENLYMTCGAAASLNLEYTLPDVSQSVIITRMAGRTPVPEKESIESFAAHHATMVVFLSTGMLEELSRRLIAGGYSEDTPAAIVYKATWEDEKTLICTVGTLAQSAKENNITKTALMIIGDVVEHSHYNRSELYNPEFTTEFRKASVQRKNENK